MAQNSQNEASAKGKSVLAGQPTPADPTPAEDTSSRSAWAGGAGRRRQPESARPPWRVEGLKPKDQDQTSGRSGWSRFGLIMLGLLIANLDPVVPDPGGHSISSDDLLHVLRNPGEIRATSRLSRRQVTRSSAPLGTKSPIQPGSRMPHRCSRS